MTTLTMESILLGAALKLNIDQEEVYAQLIDKCPNQVLTIARLVSTDQHPGLLLLDDNPESEINVPLSAVVSFSNIDNLDSMKEHKRAWLNIGVRLVRSTEEVDYFVETAKEDQVTIDIGDGNESDDDEETGDTEEDGMHGYESDDGFVVPDDECEAFTHANPNDSTFVEDVHQAVTAYNDWNPQDQDAQRFRAWMDRFEQTYTQKDDEQQFAQGTSISYTQPPLKKTKK